jgi:hypothetical protein
VSEGKFSIPEAKFDTIPSTVARANIPATKGC